MAEELLTWESKSDWSSASGGHIDNDSILLDLSLQDFESSTLGDDPDGWDVFASNGRIVNDRSYSGSQSFKFDEDISDPNGSVVTLASTKRFATASYDTLRMRYQETSSSNGHGMRVFDRDGNLLVTVATANPQVCIEHGGGKIVDSNVDPDYDEWREFTITIDYENNTMDILWEDLTGGDSDKSWSDLAFVDSNFSEVHEITASYPDIFDPDAVFNGPLSSWYDDMPTEHASSGTITSIVKSFSEFETPDISSVFYDLNGGSIDIDIIGTPDGGSYTEIQNIVLDGSKRYDINWQREHKEIQLDINMQSSSEGISPKLYMVELTEAETGVRSVTWEDNADWTNAPQTQGVVFESTPDTDLEEPNVVKRGYSVANPIPTNPYVYWPMHEDDSQQVNDFGDGMLPADILNVAQNREGVLNPTSYRFSGTGSYISVGKILGHETFQDGTLESNWIQESGLSAYSVDSSPYVQDGYSITVGSTYGGDPGSGFHPLLTQESTEPIRPDIIQVSYWEQTDSGGCVIQVGDPNGNEICAFGSDNPQLGFYSSSGNDEYVDPADVSGSSQYQVWRRFTIEFDWDNNEFIGTVEDLEEKNFSSISKTKGFVNNADAFGYISIGEEGGSKYDWGSGSPYINTSNGGYNYWDAVFAPQTGTAEINTTRFD